ncbi:MAG: FAD-dependent oxidoreductase [Myxococcota bacterium]
MTDVLIAGGGLAGLAAATVLAEQGKSVTVVEREIFLGGRAGAWQDTLADGTPFQMERGFHAFFRQYYNLRQLMRRVDPTLDVLEAQVDYPVHGPGGAIESFSGLPKQPPLNVVELLRRTKTMGFIDALKVPTKQVMAMFAYGPHTYERWDAMSAADYLDSLQFPPEARRMLFEVFAHSFFNPEEEFSAAELLMQFHFYFLGNKEGLIFDTMRRPFSAGLFDPLRAYLEARGVRFELGTSVDRIDPSEGGARWAVHVASPAGARTLDAGALVLALSVPGLKELVAGSPELGDAEWRGDVASLETTWPFAVWRLWLDRPVHDDRLPFVGTAGVGLLDNISVYEKLEDESRAWAARTGGSVLELHAYGVHPDIPEASIKANLLTGMHAVYPETESATILEDRWLLRRDCPGFPPGSHARRPTVRTALHHLTLAGDFVKFDRPSALMERAVASGFEAANILLAETRQPVEHVPNRGLLSRLRL